MAPAKNGSLTQEDCVTRHSHGLEQFFSYIKGESGLSILDLAGVNQANVSFITNLGHRIYSEDFLRSLRLSGNGDGSSRVDAFLSQNLSHREATFDGILVWDVLEYLSAPLLSATVERLFRIVKPGSYLLAMFQAQEKAQAVPEYSFRIRDSKTLLVADRGPRKPEQVFNNRSLEKLFQEFDSLKFFLARDKLREVIVKR
jgi:methyltransferase family protein